MLKRLQMLVEQKALIAQRDEAVLAAARGRFVSRLKSEITAPAVLITLFVAGIALGTHRRLHADDHDAHTDDDDAHAEPAGRLSKAAMAWLSGVRLLELARKADDRIRG